MQKTSLKKYEFLDHTSEAKFRAYGDNLEEAFENAALALTSLMSDPDKVPSKIKKQITVSAEDEKALLYDFLEELIVLKDSDAFFIHDCAVTIAHPQSPSSQLELRAVFRGASGTAYATGADVKAMTYGDMLIEKQKDEKKKDRWMLQVVVDV